MFDSVRVRLSLWYTGILALLLLTFSAGVYAILWRNFMERADGGLEDGGIVFARLPGEGDERRQEIETALSRLPAEQREVLSLKIWQELTFEQIGELKS